MNSARCASVKRPQLRARTSFESVSKSTDWYTTSWMRWRLASDDRLLSARMAMTLLLVCSTTTEGASAARTGVTASTSDEHAAARRTTALLRIIGDVDVIQVFRRRLAACL